MCYLNISISIVFWVVCGLSSSVLVDLGLCVQLVTAVHLPAAPALMAEAI